MSTHQWESILVKYFALINQRENEIDDIRCKLCENKKFVPRDLFAIIDVDAKNFISLKDLMIYLNAKFVKYEEKFLRRFIHNFDKDNDFAINFDEFLRIVLTRKNDSVKDECESRKNNEDDKIDNECENLFLDIIKCELDLVQALANIANDLKNAKDFTTYEAFISIVNDGKYITEENLGNFLYDKNVKLKKNEIRELMSRIDSDADGKISYDEFQEIFFPYKDHYTSIDLTTQNTTTNLYKSKPKANLNKSVDYDNTLYQRSTKDFSVSDKTKRIISQSQLIYDYNTSQNNFESSIISSEPLHPKSSPRRYNDNDVNIINTDVNYRARLNTYTSPLRKNETRETHRSPSPCQFNRSPRFSPNRTNIITASSPLRCRSPIHCCCANNRQRCNNLFSLFDDIINQETKIESIKEALAFCTDANLTDLFAYFDYSQRDSISIIDISEALKELGVYMSITDLKILFRRCDKNMDGRFE